MASSDTDSNPSSARRNRAGPLSQPSKTTPRAAATPVRRAASAEPTPGRPPSASARRTAANTPHGRAALRTLDERRTALFTPGRTRRRSLREQRETPREFLRNLSRVLAPATSTVHSSSSASPPEADADDTTIGLVQKTPVVPDSDEDDDEEFLSKRPRFSLPLGEEDDDDSELKVPRSSGLEEENYTIQSIELPRRAPNDLARERLDRTSLGSQRFSDYAGPDLGDDAAIDSGFFPPPGGLDDDDDDDAGPMTMEEGDALERFDADEARRQTLGRVSDIFGIEVPQLGEESTFVMAPAEPTTTQPIEFDDLEEEPPLPDQDGAVPQEEISSDGPDALPAFGDDDPQIDEIAQSATTALGSKKPRRLKSGKKMSKHGIEYPSLPQGVVKRLATTFAKTAGVSRAKLGPDTMAAIMQATDWYFEQLGDDLEAYAKHAGRKTIDESDVVTLMRRQRQTSSSTSPFALAHRYLPRELLQELRMPATK